MSVAICPNGHQSTESDFCSECGAKMPATASALASCPDCTAPRDGAEFCEVCGYNYKTRAHGEIPVAKPAPPKPRVWELTIAVEPSLRSEGSPEAPAHYSPTAIHLNLGSHLIGRTSEKRAIHPELALDHDDAVSHRHALLDLNADGHLFLRDVGSSNGTRLNGAELAPLEDIELKDGDRIELGHWTRISVKASA